MRILTTLALVGLMGTMSVQAQDRVDNFGIFDHVSAGVSLGTTGIGFEVAAPVTNYLQARVGYSFMPKFKVKGDQKIDSKNSIFKKEDGSGYYDGVDFEGKLNIGDFKILLDFYPFRTSTFRVTAGAYIGTSKICTVNTTNTFLNSKYWGNSGPELGKAPLQTYTVVSEKDGSVSVDLKTNSFKPYIGIGFGRAVPKGRVSVCFDLGVEFWGKPGFYTNISDNFGLSYQKVDKDKIVNDENYCEDIRDGLKTAEKIIAYPVLTLRVNGRIF
jgi:hypothetical protein